MILLNHFLASVRGSHMKTSHLLLRRALMTAGIALLLASSVRAAPLPPELNVVPREAALFLSVRVAEVWNDARLKPLRDYLLKDANILREFERDNGFRPEELERVTFVIPGFDSRRGPSEPCIILTFNKPHDLGRMLDAWHGMSPAEARQFDDGRRKPATKRPFVDKMDFEFKKDFPPRFKDFPKKEEFKKEDLKKQDFSDCGGQGKEDPAPIEKSRPRDLKASYYVMRDRDFLIPINDRTYVLCFDRGFRESSAIHELLAALLRGKNDGPLTPALEAAAGKHAVVAGFNLPILKNALPNPVWAEVLPIISILSSRSGTLTLDLDEEIKLGLRIDSPDPAMAKRVHDVLKAIHVLAVEMLPGLKKLTEDPEIRETEILVLGKVLLLFVDPLLRDAKFEQKESTVTVTMIAKADAAMAKALTEAIEKVREAADRSRMMNNFKMIGIAAHSYHSAAGEFPFPGTGILKGQRNGGMPNDKPTLSWRVAILPYIEQNNLFNEFRFDEPWDSDHNKKLIPKMPKIFAPPAGAETKEGHTFIRCFVGPEAIRAGMTFVNILDGTSNTFMVVDAGESVPWTKPDEIVYDSKKPLPKLGGHSQGKRLMVVFFDGSVRVLNLNKDSEAMIRAAITPNGGEVVNFP